MPSKQGARTWARCTHIDHPRFSLPQLLQAHTVNHAVQLITPGDSPRSAPAPQFDSCLAVGRLGDIVHALVASNAWPHGEGDTGVVAVAIGPRLGQTGGIAISQAGTLHMAVTKSTHQQLGLLGRRSKTAPDEWYHVEVDLTSKGCRVGQPYHQRVVDQLNEVVGHTCLALATAPLPTQPTPALPSAAATGPACRQLLAALPVDTVQPLPTNCDSWTITNVQLPTLNRERVMGAQATPAPAQRETPVGSTAALPAVASQQLPTATQCTAQRAPDAMEVDVSAGVRPGSAAHDPQVAGAEHSSRLEADAQHEGPGGMEVDEDEKQQAAGIQRGTHHGGRGSGGARAGIGGQPAENQKVRSASSGTEFSGSACVQELHDWLGGVSCRFPGAALSTLLPPSLQGPSDTPSGSVHVQEWRGLIHNHAVLEVMQHAMEAAQTGARAWTAVSVWGWEDSPCAWEGMERSAAHAVGLHGDTTSQYSVVFTSIGDVLVIRSHGVADFALPAPNKKSTKHSCNKAKS